MTRGRLKIKLVSEIMLVLAAFALVVFVFSRLPVPPDWATFGHLWRSDPYTLPGLFNPPWVAVVLSPLELLGEEIGVLVWRLISLMAMLIAARRLGVDGARLLVFLISPSFWAVIWNGQLDGVSLCLMSLGGVFAPYGATIKLQTGFGVLLYYLFWRKWKELLWLALGGVLSLLIYGWWPGRIEVENLYRGMDVIGKYQPWLALIGLPIIGYGLLKRRYAFTIYGAPLCAPYGMLHSLVAPALGLAAYLPVYVSLPAVLISWLLVINFR